MAEFIPGQEVRTDTAIVEVTINPDRPMPVGRQRFRLVVVDDSGNQSQADEVDVIVADQGAPTAVIRGPRLVASGQNFNLDGSASFDSGGGRVTTYLWTWLGPT